VENLRDLHSQEWGLRLRDTISKEVKQRINNDRSGIRATERQIGRDFKAARFLHHEMRARTTGVVRATRTGTFASFRPRSRSRSYETSESRAGHFGELELWDSWLRALARPQPALRSPEVAPASFPGLRIGEKDFRLVVLRNDSVCMSMPVNFGHRAGRRPRDDDGR
jgi:hypothetical protein